MYKKFHIKMMKQDYFNFKYEYIPFDKIINKKISKEDYYMNQPAERWEKKSFKHRMSNDYRASLKMITLLKDNKTWLQFAFKSQKLIEKNEEFFFEFSITDKVDFGNSKEIKQRRNEFFTTNFSSISHAIRNITFQIESYNNTAKRNKKIPFEPVLFVDEKELIDTSNYQEETIYYKKWSWKIIKTPKIPKKIRFELHEL